MDKYQTLHELENPENNVYPNIQAPNIPSGAIDGTKLAFDSVTASKIANQAVQAQHLSPGAVEALAIASGAVETDKLASLAVTTAKIANLAITGDKIASSAIANSHLSTGCVTSSKISFAQQTLYQFGIPSLEALVDFLYGFLGKAYFYKIYYYRFVEESEFYFSTINFEYKGDTGVLKLYFDGLTFTLSDSTSFADFMSNYSRYIFVESIA